MSQTTVHSTTKQSGTVFRVNHPDRVKHSPNYVGRGWCRGMTDRRSCWAHRRLFIFRTHIKVKSIGLREEGGDNPLLSAWKAKAVGEPGFLAEVDDDDDTCEDLDPLDENGWDVATQQDWTDFLQQSRLKDCQWWDTTHVDPGFPAVHVDLDRE